ncbi:S-layer homology domain-containing protein [Fusibacter sp. JL216-2]|uniref:S-layer homology domain-containing protein n=1 Tax=Fusibacter sp. JL216-2 TaxID=3071453 RepID=UPI003D331454
MKKGKRLLSFMMCFMLLITSLPATTYALEENGVNQPEELSGQYEHLVTSGGAIEITYDGGTPIEEDIDVVFFGDKTVFTAGTNSGELKMPDLKPGYYDVKLAMGRTPDSLLPYSETQVKMYLDEETEAFYVDDDIDLHKAQVAVESAENLEAAELQFEFDNADVEVDSVWSTASGNYLRIEALDLSGAEATNGRFRLVNHSRMDYICSDWIPFEWSRAEGMTFEGSPFSFENHIQVELNEPFHEIVLNWYNTSLNIESGFVQFTKLDGSHEEVFEVDDFMLTIPELPNGEYEASAVLFTQDGMKLEGKIYLQTTDYDSIYIDLEEAYNGECFTFETQLQYEDYDGSIYDITDADIPVSIWGSYYTGGYMDDLIIAENGLISIELPPGDYDLEVNEGRYKKAQTNPFFGWGHMKIEGDSYGSVTIDEMNDLPLSKTYLIIDANYDKNVVEHVNVDVENISDRIDFSQSYDNTHVIDWVDWGSESVIEDRFRFVIDKGDENVDNSEWVDLRVERNPYRVFLNGEEINPSIKQMIDLQTPSYFGEILVDEALEKEIYQAGREAYEFFDFYNNFDMPSQFRVEIERSGEVIYETMSRGDGLFYLPELPKGTYTAKAYDYEYILSPSNEIEFDIDGQSGHSEPVGQLKFAESNLHKFARLLVEDQGKLISYEEGFWYEIYEITSNSRKEVFEEYFYNTGIFIPKLPDGKYEIIFENLHVYDWIPPEYIFEVKDGEYSVDFDILMERYLLGLDTGRDSYNMFADIESNQDIEISWENYSDEFYITSFGENITLPIEFEMNLFDIDGLPDGSTGYIQFYYDGSKFIIDGREYSIGSRYDVDIIGSHTDGKVVYANGKESTTGIVYVYEADQFTNGTPEDDIEFVDYTYLNDDGMFNVPLYEEGEYYIIAELDDAEGSLSIPLFVEVDNYEQICKDGQWVDEVVLLVEEKLENPTTVKGRLDDGTLMELDEDVWVLIESIDDRQETYTWEHDLNSNGQVQLPDLADGSYDIWIFPELPEWFAFESLIKEFTVTDGIWSIDKNEIVLKESLYNAQFTSEVEDLGGIDFEIESENLDGMGTSSSGPYIRIEEIEGETPFEGRIRAISENNDVGVAASQWRNFKYDGEKVYVNGQVFKGKTYDQWELPTAQVKGKAKLPENQEELYGKVYVYRDDTLVDTTEFRERRSNEDPEYLNVFYLGNLDEGQYTLYAKAYNYDELGVMEQSTKEIVVVNGDGQVTSASPVLRFEEAPTDGQPLIKFSSETPTQGFVTCWVEPQSMPIIEMKIGDGPWERTSGLNIDKNTNVYARFKKSETDEWSPIAKATVDWIDHEKPVIETDLADGFTNKETFKFTVTATDNTVVTDLIVECNGDEYDVDASGQVIIEFEDEENVITILAADEAGNVATHTASIILDKTPPVVTLSYSTHKASNRNVLVSYDVDEAYEIVSGGAYFIFEDNGTHTFEVKDKAGNITKTVAKVDWIDKTPASLKESAISIDGKPVTASVTGGNTLEVSAEYSENVTVQAFIPGIGNLQTVKDGSNEGSRVTFIWTVPENANGTYRVHMKATDEAGNTTINQMEGVLVDNKAPTLTAYLSADTKISNGYLVEDTAKLVVKSNADEIMYGFSKDALTERVDETGLIVLAGEGKDEVIESIYLKAVNSVGNASEIKEITVNWDNVKPNPPSLYISNFTTKDKSVNVLGHSETGKTIIFKKQGEKKIQIASVFPRELSNGIQVNVREGLNTFLLITKDDAGNMSEATELEVTADFTKPRVKVGETEDKSQVSILSNEDLTRVSLKINDGQWQTIDDIKAETQTQVSVGDLSSGANKILVRGYDKFGNMGTGSLSKLSIGENETLENAEISESMTLAKAAFTKETKLAVSTVDVEAESGKNFVSEPVDFSLDSDAEIKDYVLVRFDIGTDHNESTKLYYLNEEDNVWLALDKSQAHGDSFYNPGQAPLDHTFTSPSGEEVRVSIQPGELVAMLVHFSTYGAQSDTTAPRIDVDELEYGLTSTESLDMNITTDEPVEVTVYVNEKQQETFEIEDAGTLTAHLEEGDNTIKISAVDKSGNTSAENPSFEMELDSTRPSLQVTLQTDALTRQDQAVFEVQSSDKNFKAISINHNGQTSEMTGSELEIDFNLSEGDNVFEFTAVDEAGNISEKITEKVRLDTEGPSISIDGAAKNDILAKNTAIAIASSDTDLKTWSGRLYKNNDLYGSYEMNDGKTIVTSTETGSDTYQLDVTAEDQAGNFTTESLTFIVDREVPEIKIDGLPESMYTNESVTLSVGASPEDANVTTSLTKDGQSLSFENETALSEDGTYMLSVTAVRGGKFATTEKTFVIDTTKPEISVSGFASSNTGDVQVNYTVTDINLNAYTASIQYGNGQKQDLLSGQTFTAVGTYLVEIEATDLGGNTELYKQSFEIKSESNSNNNSSNKNDNNKKSKKKSSGGSGGDSTITVTNEPTPQGGLYKAFETRQAHNNTLMFEDGFMVLSPAKSGETLENQVVYKRYAADESVLSSQVGVHVASDVVDLSSDENTLKSMATVTMKVDGEKVLSPETLIVYRFDIQNSVWEPVGGFYNPETETIAFKTKELGKFVAMSVSASFADAPQEPWKKNAIETLASRKVISGYMDGSFRPEKEITRAEFAAILCNAVEAYETNTSLSFTDVDGQWYEDVLKMAVTNGFMSGYNGQMRPNDSINREQMAVMVMNAFDSLSDKNVENISMNFKDSNEMSAWALQAIAKAHALGILEDMATENYTPKQNSTRAEAAVMVYRLLKAIESL